MDMRTIVVLATLSTAVLGATLLEEATKAGATTLVDLLKSVGLDKNLETEYLTVFAPTNEAFANLPEELAKTVAGNASILSGILEFHATSGIFRSQDAFNDMMIESKLQGSKIRVNVYNGGDQNPLFITLNGAKVMKGDIQASNGILHLVDKVMLPPVGTFYDLISMSKNHTVLKDIVDKAGLKQAMETTTGTLFAPTDMAFVALNNFLTSKNIEGSYTSVATKEITMYHILSSVVWSAGAQNGTYVTADKAEKLTINVAADLSSAMVNQANVVMPDIAATNGVIHVIDSVLIPEPYASGLASMA